MRARHWKRTIVVDNEGKPLTVWHRGGLQICQDAVSRAEMPKGTELVFNVYEEDGREEPIKWLGEAKTIQGAKRLASTLVVGQAKSEGIQHHA